MTVRRFESTVSSGEIKFGFLFNSRWPQLTKGDFPWLKKVTENQMQLLLCAQNVIKHRSVSISGLLYLRLLVPSRQRVKTSEYRPIIELNYGTHMLNKKLHPSSPPKETPNLFTWSLCRLFSESNISFLVSDWAALGKILSTSHQF